MVKHIVWNGISLKLPSGWEVVNEGGSRLNGVLVVAPVEGAKFEVYWRYGVKKLEKEHDRYVGRLIKRGYVKKSRMKYRVAGHETFIDYIVGDDVRVYVASWNCESSKRFFIAQLDGSRVSQSLFIELLNAINCHPGEEVIDWRMMGIGVKLYSDYFLVDRMFKIGYSMAYFVSRDKKVHVLQYAIPRYVVESHGFDQEGLRERHLKQLLPRFTQLDRLSRDHFIEYVVRHRFFKAIKYGYLLERVLECRKPDYIQSTFVKTNGKRLDEAREIIKNTYCVEW